jgi:glycogen operon protein
LVERIAEDPVLRDIKLIAEAWDAGGAYQVGNFGDHRWADWNGRFRDEVRQFWLGSGDMKGAFASRLTGSADLYQWTGRDPTHSINFITAHDGFTLRDLVSYNEKHNLANGEDNRDGSDANYSWNCGVEGETVDPVIEELRLRLQKNLVASLFLSLGVPMFFGGDEFGRTQKGNNNAYCQDNEVSWYDWSFLERNRDLHNFCRQMIRFRKENPVFSRNRYFTGRPTVREQKADILWFDAEGKPQAWNAGDPTLACWINGTENESLALYLMFNPSMEDRKFQVPEGNWTVRVDTSQDSRDEEYTIEGGGTVFLQPKSLMVLSAHSAGG